MKKSAFPIAALLLGVSLSGCPIYDGEDYECFDSNDCAYGYVCDAQTSACVPEAPGPATCQRPDDCGTNETCSKSGTCLVGDCHFSSIGCVRGYECSTYKGRWACVRPATSGEGGEGGLGGSGASGEGPQGGKADGGAASGGPT